MASIGQKLGANEPVAVPNAVAGLQITPARLRYWGVQSALSLTDQGFTSGAGFLVNLLLARWMPAPVYGAFAVAFAGFLFVSGFHNVLLLEPMSVLGPSRHAGNLPGYFRAQLKIHGLLVGALSAVVLVASAGVWMASPTSPLVGAMAGSGLALPSLLLLWLVRRMCYVLQRPSAAVLGSAFYLAFVAAGLFLLARAGWLGSFAAFVLMGAGSAAAALVLWWGLARGESRVDAAFLTWRETLRENWGYGKLLAAGTVMLSIGNQAQPILVAAFLGLGAAGILRASQIPALLMTQVVMASGPITLPRFASDFSAGRGVRVRHRAILVTMGLGIFALIFAAMLFAFPDAIERITLGGRYSEYSRLMPLLALVPVANAFSQGLSMALRASQRPGFDLIANSIATPSGIVLAVWLMKSYGLFGAALSLVLSAFIYTFATWWSFFRSDWPSRENRGVA